MLLVTPWQGIGILILIVEVCQLPEGVLSRPGYDSIEQS